MSYKIFLNDQPCGAGKTYNELLHMVMNRASYLLAVDRKEVMSERSATIRELSDQLGKRVQIVEIKSGDECRDYRDGLTTTRISRSVSADVEAAPERHAMDHVIVIITHEALKLTDLSGYRNWHLVIDETPSLMDTQRLFTTLSREFFKRHYALHRRGNHYEVRSHSKKKPADFRRDSLTHPLTVMHARVLDPKVVVLTESVSWDNLGKEGAWSWTSISSPEHLAVFRSVTILANAFKRSLTYAVMNWKWPEIEWVPHQRVALRKFAHRKMTIRYFAERHTASRALFGSDAGKERLQVIAKWIAANTNPHQHIWTCNAPDEPSLRGVCKQKRLRPRQAGSNAYAEKAAVTAIYTAKPTPAEQRMFQDMGIAAHVATETREFETIFQFVCRCAVRDPQSTADLTVNVYDRAQADYLAELFQATGYVDCTLELVDLGFAMSAPARPGPKARVKTPAELRAFAHRKREQASNRKRKQRQRDRRTPLSVKQGQGRPNAEQPPHNLR